LILLATDVCSNKHPQARDDRMFFLNGGLVPGQGSMREKHVAADYNAGHCITQAGDDWEAGTKQ